MYIKYLCSDHYLKNLENYRKIVNAHQKNTGNIILIRTQYKQYFNFLVHQVHKCPNVSHVPEPIVMRRYKVVGTRGGPGQKSNIIPLCISIVFPHLKCCNTVLPLWVGLICTV